MLEFVRLAQDAYIWASTAAHSQRGRKGDGPEEEEGLLMQDHTHGPDDHELPLSRTANTSQDRSSTAFLDGLRGLAAVLVFIQHYVGGFTYNEHEYGFGQEGHYHFASLPFLRIIWNGGNASVVIFFVLSGYVLSIGYLQKLKQGKAERCRWALLSAVLRRPLRLYAPALVVSFIYAMLLHVPGPLVLPLPWLKPQEGGIWAEIGFFAEVSLRFFSPFQVHGSSQFWYPYNMVMWTIPIELKGSMLIFGLLALLSWKPPGSDQKKALLPTAFLFLSGAIMLQMCWKWSMASFLFGMALAIIDTWKLDQGLIKLASDQTRSAFLWASFFAGWYLLSQPAHAGDITYSSHTPGWSRLTAMVPAGYGKEKYYRYWQSWGALLLVYPILRLPSLQHFLARKPLRFLGKVSFMLYLVHLPLFRIFGDRMNNLFGGSIANEALEGTFWTGGLGIPNFGPVGLSLRFLVCVTITFPLVLLVASWGTDWIDTPSVKLGKSITARLGIDGRGKRTEQENGASLLPITRRNSF